MPPSIWSPLRGAVLLLLLSPGEALPQEFQVELTRENRVSFLSDAPLEDFSGVTDRVDGFVYLPQPAQGEDLDLGESELHFEVDLASLDTGISLRNRHMRENYLDTDRFPYAVFSGRVNSLRREGDKTLMVTATGDLAIHGVSRQRDIACSVEAGGSESFPGVGALGDGLFGEIMDLRVRCFFNVRLSDHEIPIPKLMFMKVDEVMELEVDLQLRRVQEEGE